MTNETSVKTQHTPGPWYVAEDYYGGWSIRTSPNPASNIDGEGSVFQNTGRGSGSPTFEDARLMAAAPELLGALLELKRTMGNLDWADLRSTPGRGFPQGKVDAIKAATTQADAAIAKATGCQS